MFRRVPTRSTIGISRARPGSSVRTYRPKRSTVHSYPCGTDLTAIATKITANTTMRRTKTAKGLSMSRFHQSFRSAEDRSPGNLAPEAQTPESKPSAEAVRDLLLAAVRFVDSGTAFF